MITRVLDAKGAVVHDCVALNCDVSWDGFAMRDGVNVAPPALPGQAAPPAQHMAKGDRVPGGQDPGPEWEQVDARTVRHVPPDVA